MKACVRLHAPAVLPWQKIPGAYGTEGSQRRNCEDLVEPSACTGNDAQRLSCVWNCWTFVQPTGKMCLKLHVVQSVIQSIVLWYSHYTPHPPLQTANSVNYGQLTANKIHVTVLPIFDLKFK